MGELFQRPSAKTALDWTGERFTPKVSGQVELEHLHRYFLARELCRGLDVLDIASGEGYGSALLAQVACSVVGVEVDEESVKHAKNNYHADNLEYRAGKAEEIPVDGGSVDCVVSFETIEHFYDQEKFLAEIKRVLRPGGFALISSPNRDVYSGFGTPPNPHHVRELTQDEFQDLLSHRFQNVAFFGQRAVLGSVIVCDRGHEDQKLVSFDRRSEDRFEASYGLARSVYCVAVVSDSELPASPNSIYFDLASVEDAVVKYPAVNAAFTAEKKENELLRGEVRRLEQSEATINAKVADREAALATLKVDIEAMVDVVDRCKRQLDAEKYSANLAEQQRDAAVEAVVNRAFSIVWERRRHTIHRRALLLHPLSKKRRKSYRDRRKSKLRSQLEGSSMPAFHPLDDAWIEREKSRLRLVALMRHPFNSRKRRKYRKKHAVGGIFNGSQASEAIMKSLDTSYAIGLPFVYREKFPLTGRRVAVFFHVYCVEEFERIIAFISNIKWPFSLFISTDSADKKRKILNRLIHWNRGSVRIDITPDTSRDFANFFVSYRKDIADFDYIYRIQTRHPSHAPDQVDWLQWLIASTIGSPEIVDSILSAFQADETLGVLAPAYRLENAPFQSWANNFEQYAKLAAKLGVTLRQDSPCAFPAGSVFWARSAALVPMLDMELTLEDLEPEASNTDETPLHAIERMTFLSAEVAGFGWNLVWPQARKERSITAPGELRQALLEKRKLLLPIKERQGYGSEVERSQSQKARFKRKRNAELDAFLATDQRIELPSAETPIVSVVVVLFNSAELTFPFLLSLRQAMKVPTEVIIVDNASTDRTRELLSRVDGAKIVLNDENEHFLRGSRRGAALAQGAFLLFVNNDTVLPSDCLEIATANFEDPGTGVVGAKIILPGGSLQEAGSVIWSDGTCVGYGRGQNPNSPAFQFRREVHYCSGAFMMLRRSLYLELGGFDERYAPAYYEETDLCMKIRAAGYKVIYDPRIAIEHYEFGSATVRQQAIDLQERNHKFFLAQHATALKNHPSHEIGPRAALDSLRKKRVLMIDDRVPYRNLGAGYPRARDLVKAVSALGWDVTFYPLYFPGLDVDEFWSDFGPDIEVAAELGEPGLSGFLRERAEEFDAVFVSRPGNMARVQEACGRAFLSRLKIIYDAEALFVEREKIRRTLFGNPFEEKDYRAAYEKEIGLIKGAAAVVTVCAREKELISSCISTPIHVIGHMVDANPSAANFEERSDLLFVGALDGTREVSPNVDSLIWFVEEVMPLVDQKLGTDWKLNVAGRIQSEDLDRISSERVRLLGMVPDLSQLYNENRLFIAPTRFAAGIPAKVHEAASFGLPVVTTDLIAAQVGFVPDSEILAASTAKDFADKCVSLYTDKDIWSRIREKALLAVARDCSKELFEKRVESLLGPFEK
ncbi:rhamnan synthesis F family protein [Martelella sp.]|uniref:rhamnan synthesis F family protein n=1 Tax=Martelella sp. TaxID=1969699 RepID=UPI0025BA54BD|nr:rhamnan synthesis F family protein [Martelella sp.]